MTKAEFAARLKGACASVEGAEGLLTGIDSKFGDADHGLTMSKIARAISQAVEESQGGIQEMLDDAAMAVMGLNGGSAVPLWNTWLDDLQEAAPEGDEVDVAGLKAMFAHAFEALDEISGAKAGAEVSKGFVAKYGRAKSYKEQTIGTPDAGAVSMAYFFRGLAE